MSVNQREVDDVNSVVSFKLKEQYIYGSSRTGVRSTDVNLLSTSMTLPVSAYSAHDIGKKTFELTNHLGNVLSTISDKPIAHTNGTAVDYFLADIRTTSDYYPPDSYRDGVSMRERDFALAGAEEFRFGFQGSELDGEVKGEGNSYTTFYRVLDPRLGRWMTTDPVFHPYQSTYCSMDNNPVLFNDVRGNYSEKRAQRMLERAKKRGYSTSEIHNPGGKKNGYGFTYYRENNLGTGSYSAYAASGNLKNIMKSEYYEAYDNLGFGWGMLDAIIPGASSGDLGVMFKQTSSYKAAAGLFSDPLGLEKLKNLPSALWSQTLLGQIEDFQNSKTRYQKGRLIGGWAYQYVSAIATMGIATEATAATIPEVQATAVEGSAISLTKHGQLTNGIYTVSREAMKKHVIGGVQGRSIFYPTFNAEEAVLKAAQYADETGIWKANKAKVPVLNTNIGMLGNGSPTNVTNVIETQMGSFMAHREAINGNMKNITQELLKAVNRDVSWRNDVLYQFIENVHNEKISASYWPDEENWVTLMFENEPVGYLWRKYPVLFLEKKYLSELNLNMESVPYVSMVLVDDLDVKCLQLDYESLSNYLDFGINYSKFSATDLWFQTNSI